MLIRRFLLLIVLCACSSTVSLAASADTATGPKVLIVDAHPDDETAYAGTIYKITHDLHGTVDLVVVTNGEGGYKYSTLAEPIYGLNLTDEKVGRENLPWIRKKELKAAGKIIGLHHIYFLDQTDNRYMLNPHEVLDSTIWDTAAVMKKLRSIMRRGDYDFLFTLLPTDSTHGHHKAATIMALRAASETPAAKRPVALGASVQSGTEKDVAYHELSGYPITEIAAGKPSFTFDRTQSFGYRHVLNYKVIVRWETAEHKSQGTMHLGDPGDRERFWLYDVNPAGASGKAKQLFDELGVNHYPELHYPGEIK